MRHVIPIALVLSLMLIGCQNRSGLEPVDKVANLIGAMDNRNTNTLASLLNKTSQVMARTNLTRGNGVAAFMLEATHSEMGKNYVLTQKLLDKEHAIVLLKNGKKGMDIFSDPTLPPSIKEQGLKLFLVREKGQWRIDLQTTEAELMQLGLDHLERNNKGKLPSVCPQWMPGLMGMPSPPGYRECDPS